MAKLCFGCEHFYWRNANGGCDTCHSDFDMSCDKDVWHFDAYDTTQEEYGEMVQMAENCQWFKLKEKL